MDIEGILVTNQDVEYAGHIIPNGTRLGFFSIANGYAIVVGNKWGCPGFYGDEYVISEDDA